MRCGSTRVKALLILCTSTLRPQNTFELLALAVCSGDLLWFLGKTVWCLTDAEMSRSNQNIFYLPFDEFWANGSCLRFSLLTTMRSRGDSDPIV